MKCVGSFKAYNYRRCRQSKGVVMKSTLAKGLLRGNQTIYRYNGDPQSDEVFTDRTGELPRHWVGEILRRNGKQWRVNVLRNDLDMLGSARAVPINRVYLTDKL
jgi:hypothetical protein